MAKSFPLRGMVSFLKPAEAQFMRNYGRLVLSELLGSAYPGVNDVLGVQMVGTVTEERCEVAIDHAIERALRGEVVSG